MTSLTNLLLKIFLDYLGSQIWCIFIKLGLLLLVIFVFNIRVLTNNIIQVRTSAPEFGIVSHPKYANCQKKQFRKKVQEIQPICCFFMLRRLRFKQGVDGGSWSRTFFISFPHPAFLSLKNTLKSLISTKANKKRCSKNSLKIKIKVRLPERLRSLIKEYIESITGISWHHLQFFGIWLKQNTLWQLTIKTY